MRQTLLKTACFFVLVFILIFGWQAWKTPRAYFNDYSHPVLKPVRATKEDIVALITEKAKEARISPQVALRIAMCESSMNPKAKNKHSSASGLYQITKKTFQTYCSGNVFDAEDNINCFIKLYPNNKGWWQCK